MLQAALAHFQHGRLPEAESACREVLSREPANPEAVFLLGQIAFQVRNLPAAIELLSRAVALAPAQARYLRGCAAAWRSAGNFANSVAALARVAALEPHSPQAHFELANAWQEMNRPQDAVAHYERAIALKPDFADAFCNLGLAMHRLGRTPEALALYRRALALNPAMATAHNNYGFALSESGNHGEAAASFHEAIRLRPDYAEAFCNLGSSLGRQRRFGEAAAQFAKAIELSPGLPEPHYNLANTLMGQGRPEEAIPRYETALRLKPDYWEAESALALALLSRGRIEESIARARSAVARRPDAANAARNLGVVLRESGRHVEAVACLRRAVALDPSNADALNELSIAHRVVAELAIAEECARAAIRARGDFPEAHCNLGIVLGQLGLIDEAIASVDRAIQLRPDYDAAYSVRLFLLNYSSAHRPDVVLRMHRQWAAARATSLPGTSLRHANVRDPARRLRIGYVSPDFMQHSVGVFLRPMLQQHDHSQFEIFCYSDVHRPDAVTRQLQGFADHWRLIAGLPDEEVAEMVRRDRIDILVDLAVHTGSNRLLAFARKPAPVQVTYLGYAGTTGLPAMDYKITDRHLDPPGLTEAFHSETLLRLADSYFCYQPLPDCPEVAPAREAQAPTFGAFQNLSKVSAEAIGLWSRVLQAVPGSRLILKGRGVGASAIRDRLRAAFDPRVLDQLVLEDWSDTPEYLRRLRDLDIMLDTMPFNGGTTTCHALWMGVPVISLAGGSALGRMGLSILANLGLDDLAARTPDAYVEAAQRLAADRARRTQLRATLRERMQASALMDAPRFTASLESCYREAWRRWCATAAS